ncbi:LOW QUALITY PROTEIN: dynamin-related protein 3A-like [Phalaenopsis equestris]|uniref:LOW QUALITY PROTEIN: dynamin-related protein 3A-like n=1 Tax=Phalaenopsis equestris TaxID=78828 RepID=UPI0009E4E033|nr:LOW QUALITY PROTEIN: dynamin-related protein 3A-like [Phalaenopsis equestris]
MAEEAVSGANAVPSSQQAVSPGPIGSSVIPIANKLQDIFAQLGSSSTTGSPGTMALPRVAVVGSQSSGKSSVLEALVGRDFLPRGSDICTRCPLVLQLVHSDEKEEWGEFLNIPGKRFYDFREIRREIQAETDREAGGNKGVSDKQIRLKIFSPNVLNITLVDLPGITKIPVGDQPSDIEARIRTMILSYIKHETCIVLAVSPANADLSNSDALQIAQIADPNGSRTIGVITKLDIMDRDTDARNFLLGNVIPLRLGYVAVVNRSQQDINLNRSIKDALAKEEAFFRCQPVYHGLSHCCGVPKLAKKLNQILVQHILSVLPGLKSRINSQLEAVAKEHAAYGDVVESKAGQRLKFLKILTKYSEAFTSMVERANVKLSTTELYGGAQIHYIFQSIFVKSLEEVDPCEDLSDHSIRMALQNASINGDLFVREVPFRVLLRRQIGRLLDPSLQCAKLIHDELIKTSRSLANELHQYPVLRKRMVKVIGNFLRERLQSAETMITHLIEMEMDCIDISHPNFIGRKKAMEIAQQVKASRLAASVSKPKDGLDGDELQVSEKSQKSCVILARAGANGVIHDQAPGVQPPSDSDRLGSAGSLRGIGHIGGILSIFGVSKNRAPAKEISSNKSATVPSHNVEHSISRIQPQEPPFILKPSEYQSEQEALEFSIAKLLLKSYYDIARKNIEDTVTKSIMHLLVNHTKRELYEICILKLFRDDVLDDLFRESADIAAKRKMIRETLGVLQQAYKTLEELPLEADTVEKGYSLHLD